MNTIKAARNYANFCSERIQNPKGLLRKRLSTKSRRETIQKFLELTNGKNYVLANVDGKLGFVVLDASVVFDNLALIYYCPFALPKGKKITDFPVVSIDKKQRLLLNGKIV